MKIKSLFPKFNLNVKFMELNDSAGQFWHKSDIVVLDSGLKKKLPGCAKIVFLHEMIHATGSDKRLIRLRRLIEIFGKYSEGSLSFRMEECIAEIGCMVVAMKLGLLNDYSRAVIIPGLEKNYTPDMYIPIREIRAAVKYFADDETSFEEEIEAVKNYLDAFLDIKFQDSYTKKDAA